MSSLQSYRTSQDSLALENIDLADKNVLVRVDFNCPVEDGKVTNNYRIQESLRTLEFLKEKGARKITLLTHFERPEGRYAPEFSLKIIKEELEKLWGEKVTCPPYEPDFYEYSKKISNSMSHVSRSIFQVCMWENTRFWPGEETNDSMFAQALAEGQDVFVNEAFSASHRSHSSIVGAAKLLPTYAGFRLAEEAREIYRLMNETRTPSVAIVGGAKIETKIPVLRALSKNYDKIILGGKVSIEYVGTQNFASLHEEWMDKIELPTGYSDEQKFDIDETSALHFAEIIKLAKKILWNGPVGKFEEPEFKKGSEIIAQAVAGNKKAFRLIGGGDTVELLEELDLQNEVGFVSTGGGAMLDYIANGTLPGLETLKY